MSHSLGASAPIALPTEHTVVLDPDRHWGFSEFIGSRAMLEAEGIVPAGTEWPEAYADVRWQAGAFDFWLRRQRPDGAKGPRRAFADVDWFRLRWELTNRPSWEQLAIDRKRRELADTIYRQSAKGQAEWHLQWNLYWESKKDKAFQTFKAACCIVERKRGRPCKNRDHAQGATS